MTSKKPEPLTACMKNSGFNAKSKVSAPDESQCQTESEVLLNPLLLIHAKRQAVKKPSIFSNILLLGSNIFVLSHS
jgi:hypothetical protein